MRRAEVLDLMRQGWTLSLAAPTHSQGREPFRIHGHGANRVVPTPVIVALVRDKLITGSKRYTPMRYFELTDDGRAATGMRPLPDEEPKVKAYNLTPPTESEDQRAAAIEDAGAGV